MGLFDWLRRLLFGSPEADARPAPGDRSDAGAAAERKRRRRKVRLFPLRKRPTEPALARAGLSKSRPYRFSYLYPRSGKWLDLSAGQDEQRLARFELPAFRNPEELAAWLELSPGRLAWLTHRFEERHRPPEARKAHYAFRIVAKRSGGVRLIESPKTLLRAVQRKILAEILDHVPPHPAAHGFVAERSIVTNAQPHAGRRVVVRLDLENFYPNVRLARVVAIFRSLGYAREAAIWLGRLTTSAVPELVLRKMGSPEAWAQYRPRHLPQGAPTSPALANLSAFALDLRLAGLARSFGAAYTRYADDLTFSGDEQFLRSLAVFLPLTMQIIRSERFRVHPAKRRVIRNNQRQLVTGVVVNERPNLARREYERLKATLTNCVRRGPSTQNHARHPDFAAHLRGRIAHATQLNDRRGQKLLALYEQIDWNR